MNVIAKLEFELAYYDVAFLPKMSLRHGELGQIDVDWEISLRYEIEKDINRYE